MELLSTIFVAVMAFVATNLDDLILLTAFFANNDYINLSVVLGQYLGVSLIIMICVLAYLFKFIIPPQYLGLFGILPISIGLKNLWNLRNDNSNHNIKDSELAYNVNKTKSGKKHCKLHQLPLQMEEIILEFIFLFLQVWIIFK